MSNDALVIEEIDAGTAMDMVIAELVMGWRWVTVLQTRGWFSAGRSYLRLNDAAALVQQFPESFAAGKSGRPVMERDCPPYSREMGSAWLLVEALAGRGCGFGLTDSVGPPYEATFDSPENRRAYIEWADSAPLAICRAALRLVTDPDALPSRGEFR